MRVLYCIAATALSLTAAPHAAIKDFDVWVPMRDGVRLSANVYRPAVPQRVPAILIRTPYGKGSDITEHYQAFVDRGYAIVVQDVRGRHNSEGVFRPLDQEPADGDDTLNWIAHQPWSDGRIGMMGGSYLGIVQWKAALRNNPHLKAIFPVVSGDDDYRDRFYSTGGAMKLGNRLNWLADNLRAPDYVSRFSQYVLHLPLRTSDVAATGQTLELYQKALRHPAFDAFWKSISTREQLAQVRIPVFSVGGWYDNFAESDLEAFAALRRTSGVNRIVIGPWPHNMSTPFPGVSFGKEAAVPIRTLQLTWFNRWLKGENSPLLATPPARLFLMGTNRWLEADQWPPANVRFTPFYLGSKGRANTLDGDGTLTRQPAGRAPEDHFVYDPANPVPTRGGPVCCNPRVFPWGPMDQRPVEKRSDVLVFTSSVLARDLPVAGPVKATLYVSTSAPDTDFTAKLVDVFPGGEARNLADGILRLRYRDGLEKESPATPGAVTCIDVDIGVTGNVFLKGHRIRLEISSSNFPRFDRNPNTGGLAALETRLVKAAQTIFHDRRHPSRLLLPVLR